MLDAVGDLALAGAPLLARYTGNRAGHALTNKLLRAVFADPANWQWVVLAPGQVQRLPGAGVCVPAPAPRATAPRWTPAPAPAAARTDRHAATVA